MDNKLSENRLIKNNKILHKDIIIINEEEKTKYFNTKNNYIDYFIEIGINPTLLFHEELFNSISIDSINKLLIPEIISKFPNFDKKSVVLDNVIIQSIFPEGFKCIETNNKPDPIFYSIILDNQMNSSEYIHKYVSCLIIYESISNYIILNELYKYNKLKNKNFLEKCNKYYIPKCIGIISLFPYIDKFEEILRSLYELFLSRMYINLYLEEIIMNLVIEIPKVPRGFKRVILRLPNKTIDLTENKMNSLPTIHSNLSQAIGHFSLENLIDIYTYLLLETKMIFFSSKIQELSNTILSFLLLLTPLKYQYQIVSVLPKQLFSFCQTLSPFIFGINESYYPHYFKKNKIEIEDSTICVVDIDSGKYFMIAPGAELDEEEYPDLPRNLREKLEKKINKYYQKLINDSSKKNNIKEDNKKYQKIFYNFMIHLFKDYTKYLKRDYGVRRTIKMDIQYMMDLDSYIKSKDASERNFYTKILSTQMFIEFIYKRMMPKDNSDKIEVLFFEEKMYKKSLKSKMLNRLKIAEESTLLSSKEYDYDKNSEIIDLSNISTTSKEIIRFFNDINNEHLLLKECLNKGFSVEKNVNNNKYINNNIIIKFNYFLFPLLFNERIFKININNFRPAKLLYKSIENINAKIVNKIHLKSEHRKNIKNSEIENDNYLAYLIIWSLTFWYTDKEERDYRFFQMIEILDKIEEHEIEIFEVLFESVVKHSSEQNIRLLYKKFIERKLNPSWKIFSLVSKYLKSNHKTNIISKSTYPTSNNSDDEEYSMSKSKSNKNIKNKNNENKKFYPFMYRSRTLKNADTDENIVSDDVQFVGYSQCYFCKNIINLGKLCSNLSTTIFIKDKKTEIDKIKCPNKTQDNKNCEKYNEQKLIFQFGVELFNFDLEYESTCSYLSVPLFSPSTLKKKLLLIVNNLPKNKNFNVEMFKIKYPNEFWNCLWYFQLNNMDISFMLPYIPTTNNSINEVNDNFNIRFSLINNLTNKKTTKNNIKNDTNLIIEKNDIKKYRNKDICKQEVFQFGILQKKFVNYMNLYSYHENIGYNEMPLLFSIKDYEFSKNNKINIKKRKKNDFWTSFINRIAEKTNRNIHHAKNKSETIMSNLINIFENRIEENKRRNENILKKNYNIKNYDIKNYKKIYKANNNHKDEDYYNVTFMKRGTLINGVLSEENNTKNDSYDFEV